MSDEAVTTVVMTRDRWDDLERSLPHHRGAVVLVDNGSRDGTPARVRARFPHVQVVEAGRNLGAPARNIGVERARTRYVAFADDDSWWQPEALDRAVELLDRFPGIGLLAARVLVEPDRKVDPVSEAMACSPLGREPGYPGPHVLGFLACGAVVRRSAFLAVGGFDDVLFFLGEEELLALDLVAAGWQVVHAPAVVAHHDPSTQRPDSRSRTVRAVRNRLLVAVMRRPWWVATTTLAGALASGTTGVRGALAALPRLPRALSRRRRLPAAVERRRRMLDAPS